LEIVDPRAPVSTRCHICDTLSVGGPEWSFEGSNLAQYISKGTDPQLTAYYNSEAGKVFQNLVNTKYYPSVASLTSTSILNNYSFSTRSPLNVDQGDFKVDYNLSEKDHFSGRYSREEQVNNPVNSLLLVSVNLGTAIMSNGVLDWTHSFNTRLVNDFRFGVNWVQLVSNGSANPGIGDGSGTETVLLEATDQLKYLNDWMANFWLTSRLVQDSFRFGYSRSWATENRMRFYLLHSACAGRYFRPTESGWPTVRMNPAR
jgi:hypothetical protein